MKRLIALFVFLLFATASWCQPNQLIIQGSTGQLYLEHTVSAKENWYSIGRMYNISPKEIAPFNSLAINKPLEIGQQLKIPLKSANFSQHTSKSSDETLVPVYHIIQEKEWMYHISMNYNKVPLDALEKWNHITRDQAKAGMQLIVGYLKVKTSQSALAGNDADKMAILAPANKDEAKTSNVSNFSKEDKKPDSAVKRQTLAKTAPVPTANKTSTPENSITESVRAYSDSHSTGGFFSADFINSNKSSSGEAGTFKSTSGWHDGKYYALMNNVPVGTILKLTSPATNKTVYAKVLGQLPDMKESQGLAVRISNSAAAELGTGEGKFPVDVKY